MELGAAEVRTYTRRRDGVPQGALSGPLVTGSSGQRLHAVSGNASHSFCRTFDRPCAGHRCLKHVDMRTPSHRPHRSSPATQFGLGDMFPAQAWNSMSPAYERQMRHRCSRTYGALLICHRCRWSSVLLDAICTISQMGHRPSIEISHRSVRVVYRFLDRGCALCIGFRHVRNFYSVRIIAKD